mmetsp:Transcript_20757/g.41147  ORF Transcript_20757/g.41147 Transcript_20757/m.41147 type:complete len:238 (-) Transcript_20757:611-1324(-)
MQKSQDRQAPGIAAHVVAQAHEVRRLDGECGEGGRRTAAAVAAAEKEFCERHVALPEGSAEVLGARGGARLEEDTDARLACPKQNGLLEQRAPVLVPWLAPVAEVEVPPPLRPVLEQEVFKHGSTAPGPGGFAEDGGGNDGIIYPWHHRAVRGQGPHDRNAPPYQPRVRGESSPAPLCRRRVRLQGRRPTPRGGTPRSRLHAAQRTRWGTATAASIRNRCAACPASLPPLIPSPLSW